MQKRSAYFYITLILTISLSVIAIDSLIPAIPAMVESFRTDPSLAQLSIGLYLAGYALGQIPVGLLSDRFGRRPIFITGMVVFTLMSIASVFANDINQFLVIRFFQGLAGTVGPVCARAIARDTHHGKDLDNIMAILVTSLAAGALVAPILGTAIVVLFGWKAPLVLNALIGFTATVLLITSMPESHKPNRHLHPWLQTKDSAKHYFSIRQVVWASMIVSFTFFAYFSIATGLGSVLVDYYNYSAKSVGWGFALAVSFYMVSAQVCRVRIRKNTSTALLINARIFYLATGVIGLLFLALLANGVYLPVWSLYVLIMIFLFGMGHTFAPASALTMEPIGHIAGFGASMLGTLQMGLGTAGAALTALFYDQTPASLIAVMVFGAGVSSILMLRVKSKGLAI